MNRTLLYTVQRVLDKLDLDAVNSINDSQDAALVAREAEDTFYDLVNRSEWPQRYDLLSIESVSDVNNPTALRLPDNMLKLVSIRYNTTESGDENETINELHKVTVEEFLNKVYSRPTSDTAVTKVSYKGVDLYVYNNKAPEFYACFDNEHIILDSYNSAVESVVQGSKTVAVGSTVPTFTQDDTFLIPVDSNTYPLYLSEVAAAASLSLNGVQSPEEERRRNRGISKLRRDAYRTEQASNKNNFGRFSSRRV